ncbi:MAG: hypothetical protein PHQ74_03670 [Crocinitomicaceae bacterium]|nr:hypothetical protein [Crocinitomicaceae bacterium]
MINQSQIYKFASLRSPKSNNVTTEEEEVLLETELIYELTTIVESDESQEVKLTNYNDVLQGYINSVNFIKTKKEYLYLKENFDQDLDLIRLYNNIVVRTLTKSTTNQIFKLIIDGFREFYPSASASRGLEQGADGTSREIRIIIPESIKPSFIGFKGTNKEQEEPDIEPKLDMLNKLNNLAKTETLLSEAAKQNVASFTSLGQVIKRNLQLQNILSYLQTDSIIIDEATTIITADLHQKISEQPDEKTFNRTYKENSRSSIREMLLNKPEEDISKTNQLKGYLRIIDQLNEQGVTKIENSSLVLTEDYDLIYSTLMKENFTVEEGLDFVKVEMNSINYELKNLIGVQKLSLIGSKWVNTTAFEHAYIPDRVPNNIVVRDGECDLKFPYQVADLRVVETETVGYLPGEIAHINNTQAGEKHIRETRRLKRTESFESYIIDDEMFRETDTQSTEKFSLENISSSIQSKANAISVSASASGSFGPVNTSIDAGFSNSNSSLNSSVVAQKESKEIFESVVDRVSKRVRSERSTMAIEEFEEKVTHEIDNGAEGTKSYVYRWLNKIIRGTLKNYGKRLMFEIEVVHPSHYYLSRAIKQPGVILIPDDPREANINGTPVLTIDNITRDNYHIWSILYKIDIERPPAAKIIVSETLNGSAATSASKMVNIPDDYVCFKGKAASYYKDFDITAYLICTIGVFDIASWGEGDRFLWNNAEIWCNGETKQIPISVIAGDKDFYINVEIECLLSDEAYKAWKINTYNSIIAAYDALVEKSEEQKASFDPNRPGINPLKKDQMVKDEIKREAIGKMFRCNPFWLKDNYVVGNEYNPKCCTDSLNAEKVKFIETAFDWANMTYQLHPYFYSDKNNWADLLDLSDDNPHFESFMQASYATVRVPVFRDDLKERAAINFLEFNSLANYEVIPEGLSTLLDEMSDSQPSKFEYDINGERLPEPVDTIDLGIFKVPTDLVILECGNRDGVKPIAYPESEDEPTSDVIIPKQYSPAIIADSCDID